MKISRAEGAALALAAAFLLFFAGWFVRGAAAARNTYVISGEHPALAETPAVPDQDRFVPDELLDLNTATQADLEALPGIGPTRAAAILDYRAQHGPFAYPEQLTDIPGIGQSTYEALAGYITVKEVDPS